MRWVWYPASFWLNRHGNLQLPRPFINIFCGILCYRSAGTISLQSIGDIGNLDIKKPLKINAPESKVKSEGKLLEAQ